MRIVLYGAGYCGHETLSLMRKYGISVFTVCNDGRVGEYLDGILITYIGELEPSSDLRIYITSGFNRAMEQKLQKLGLYYFYTKLDFGRYEEEKEKYEYFRIHRKEIESAYELLNDNKSKTLYKKLVQYRICRDIELLDDMQEMTPQYYPKEIDLPHYIDGRKHIFLDCGAYDGDSLRGFMEYTEDDYEGIIAVEASKKNYDVLLKNTQHLGNVKCINIGISDEHKVIRFNISEAKNSFASEEGEDILEVDSIDNIIGDDRVTFIKMDIEGAVFDAFRGARKTITKNRPIMAISVYHLVDDLWRLQLLIEEMIPEAYDYYIRHYSPTIIETILYAVPKKRRDRE